MEPERSRGVDDFLFQDQVQGIRIRVDQTRSYFHFLLLPRERHELELAVRYSILSY
jgi:hypothetical protein